MARLILFPLSTTSHEILAKNLACASPENSDHLSRVIRPLFQVFAAGVIFNQENKILLVKSTYQRFHPRGLPGGSMEYGESPEAAHFSLDDLPDVRSVDVDMINQLYKMVEFQNYALGNGSAVESSLSKWND